MVSSGFGWNSKIGNFGQLRDPTWTARALGNRRSIHLSYGAVMLNHASTRVNP